ncbi:MAG TPA: WG repeat-containing protein [Tenuifilaceae bacterium]|nr:WG repeat-containing protein [Tenuifilaceae bacterium]
MENRPKPTRELISDVLNIKARLDSFNLNREYEIINSLNKHKDQIMESYDWSDQEFEENGKYGLKDCFGEILIPAQYDETWFRSSYFVTREKPIACRKGNKWGMVMPDGKGSEATEFLYDNIILGEYYSFWNLIVVAQEEKYGFIDIKGNPLTPVDIDEIYQPANDMGKVRKANKYGFIYYNGDYVEPIYDKISFSESDKYYHVMLNGQWGFVDRNKGFVPAERKDEAQTSSFYGITF